MRKLFAYWYFLLLVVLNLILRGITLMMLWKWFCVTKFGLPLLDVRESLGIVLILGLLTYQDNDCVSENPYKYMEFWEILRAVTWVAVKQPLAVLIIGYIVSRYA